MRYLVVFLLYIIGTHAYAQDRCPLFDSFDYKVEMQASLSAGDHTPLWLNANKYGLSSLEKANGYLRGALSRPLNRDNGRRWGVGYGLDIAVAGHYTSRLIVQQAYVEGRWLKGVLTVGSKEYPMELKNQELSTGAQTLGINARPVPQVRLALPDYWDIPGTNGWLALKGHIAYGKYTDSNWQKKFTQGHHRYTEGVLYHSKAGYLKIGNAEKTLVSLELGLEMAAQFGGKSIVPSPTGGETKVYQGQGGIKGMLRALIPGGEDVNDQVYHNAAGNHLGSWLARFNFDSEDWGFSLYADHYFEDHSAMLFLDYDGYGEGKEWNVKKKRRYFLYALKDIQIGLDVRFKDARWINNVVLEFFHSKYQSGPIYHDHDETMSDHISGLDDYYNHLPSKTQLEQISFATYFAEVIGEVSCAVMGQEEAFLEITKDIINQIDAREAELKATQKSLEPEIIKFGDVAGYQASRMYAAMQAMDALKANAELSLDFVRIMCDVTGANKVESEGYQQYNQLYNLLAKFLHKPLRGYDKADFVSMSVDELEYVEAQILVRERTEQMAPFTLTYLEMVRKNITERITFQKTLLAGDDLPDN